MGLKFGTPNTNYSILLTRLHIIETDGLFLEAFKTGGRNNGTLLMDTLIEW